MEIELPYGNRKVSFKLEDSKVVNIIAPQERKGILKPEEEVRKALGQPYGTKPLRELVRNGETVSIIIDDNTRRAPSSFLLPILLDELNSVGITDDMITIVIGRGVHREPTWEEMMKLTGGEIFKRIQVLNHNPKASDLGYVGTTKYGTKVYLNKHFISAKRKILVGDIELHSFAGYGGGRKSVLPGISSFKTIKQNHGLISDSKARIGNIVDNPVHLDMVDAAHFANVDFILNVVMNTTGEIVGIYAGNLDQAFSEGVKLVDEMYKVMIERAAEIIVVSAEGYPYDLNFYQSAKGIEIAANAVSKNGIIILIAECREGLGMEEAKFEKWMGMPLEDLAMLIRNKYEEGMHVPYNIKRAFEKAQVIVVTNESVGKILQATSQFKYFQEVNEALETALEMTSQRAKILVSPYGKRTLPIVKNID